MRGSPAGGGPGGGGGGYGNGMNDFDAYSERASEIDAEHDDFYAGGGLAVEEFGQGPGQAGFRRGENDGSTSPAAASGPLLDQSHLRPGTQAALLTHERTLELYRANAKKVRFLSLVFYGVFPYVDLSNAYFLDSRPRPPVRIRRLHGRRLKDPPHACTHPRQRHGSRTRPS
jgi:hypothetical protein